MVGVHIFARGGIEALPSAAGALGHLLAAGGMAEIGGGAAHIVDIALEILVLHHLLRFPEDGFMAPGLDDPALMEGQGAEGTGAEATPVADKAEFYLFDCGNASGLCITGMPGAHIGKIVDGVHFCGGQRFLRRILDNILIAVGLCQPLGSEWIAVCVLNPEGFGIAALVCFQFLISGQNNRRQAIIQFRRLEYGAVNIGDIFHVHAGIQRVRDFHDALFSHAVHQKIRLGVQQNGALHALGPVVIVAQPPQAGLDPADEDGNIPVGLADQVAVDNGGIVGPLAHDPAGSEGVRFASVLGDGVMVHHGIHIAAGNQKSKTGAAVNSNGLGIFPVRLRNDADAVAATFQHTADDCMAKGRVVHIGVADYIYKIAGLPAAIQHILSANGKKVHALPPECILFSISPFC